MPVAFLNGRLVPAADLTLSAVDPGFASGATVVDNARTFAGRPFRRPDHLARFRRDCERCSVPLAATDAELAAAADELIRANASGADVHVVTFATPGPTLGMSTYPIQVERYRPFFTDGVSLAVVGHQPTDPGSVLPPLVKHRSRMLWHVASKLAPPGTEAVLTDRPGGTLTETAVANLLAVIDGVVCTPPRDRVLDGISLRVAEELCGELGLAFAERELPEAGVPRWSEAMLVGTGFAVAGVRRIGGVEVPWPGPVFARLLAAWSALVGVDIAGQFTDPAT